MNSTMSNSTIPATSPSPYNPWASGEMDFFIAFMTFWVPGVLIYFCCKFGKHCGCGVRRVSPESAVVTECPLPPPPAKVPEGFGKKFAKVHPIDHGMYDIRVPDIPFYVVSPGERAQIGVWKIELNKPTVCDEV